VGPWKPGYFTQQSEICRIVKEYRNRVRKSPQMRWWCFVGSVNVVTANIGPCLVVDETEAQAPGRREGRGRPAAGEWCVAGSR